MTEALMKTCRLRVAITFHFIESRLLYLAKIVENMRSFRVASLEFIVYTNTSETQSLKAIETIFDCQSLKRIVVTCPLLAHPFDLTWEHKSAIDSWIADETDPTTHFLYLEDDLLFEEKNLSYFLRFREVLDRENLIPGFCRFELHNNRRICLDQIRKNNLKRRRFFDVGDRRFVALDNPYSGCFLLDRALAKEHLQSPSFDLVKSKRLSGWGVRERAAAGLACDKSPIGFTSRLVVPICAQLRIDMQCCFNHLPNNYYLNDDSPYGKIELEDLLVGNFDEVYGLFADWRAVSRFLLQRWSLLKISLPSRNSVRNARRSE